MPKSSEPFQNRLPVTLTAIDRKIQEILLSPCPALKDVKNEKTFNIKPDTPIDVRSFLCRLFGIEPKKFTRLSSNRQRDETKEMALLRDLLNQAEEELVRHISRRNEQMKLVMSGIIREAGVLESNRSAIFTVSDLETELDAAGVPHFWFRVPQNPERILERFNELPDSVKESFFATSWRGERDLKLPFWMASELLLFTSDLQWLRLKGEATKRDVMAFELFCENFLSHIEKTHCFFTGQKLALNHYVSIPNEDLFCECLSRQNGHLDFVKSGNLFSRIRKRN